MIRELTLGYWSYMYASMNGYLMSYGNASDWQERNRDVYLHKNNEKWWRRDVSDINAQIHYDTGCETDGAACLGGYSGTGGEDSFDPVRTAAAGADG